MDQTACKSKINILIIGAGISGLTSALKLQQKEPSLQIRIMESSYTIGGQLRATHLGEIGAKWITEDQCHIYRLLRSLNVPTSRRTTIGGPELKRYWEIDDGLFASLAKFELKRYIRELDLKMEFYKPGLENPGKQSMSSHIRKRLFFSASRKFMMNLVLLISGTDALDIKYVDFMNICYTSGGIKRLIDLLIEVPNTMLEFSSKDLLITILNNLKYPDILYDRKACEVLQYRDYVEVRDSKNEYHIADAVILAIPWNCIEAITFWPPLPLEMQKAPPSADKMKYVITSFLASYREAHWRNNGYSGQYISHEPLLVAQEYRPTTICGYYMHEEGIDPLVGSIILHKISEKFGEGILIPRDFIQHTFDLNNLGHLTLTTPWNRVIWSSSEAAGTCYRGRLGGAVQSGYRAALNALLVARPQVVSWQDISEIQCHDYLHRRDATWSSLWLSSWNLYNVTTYTLLISGLVLVLSRVYKNH